jgi:hypothetical protein
MPSLAIGKLIEGLTDTDRRFVFKFIGDTFGLTG